MKSRRAILSGLMVSAALLSTHAGTFNANFNDGQVPAGSQIFGNALVEAGGISDTPCLKLTKNVNGQGGSWVINDIDNLAQVYGVRVSFMARVGAGTEIPADGWSFSMAPDLPDASWSETGAGTGLTVQFDTYDNVDNNPSNAAGEAPQIRLVVGGQVVARTPLLPLSDMINSTFVPVEIKLDPDGSFDLTYNGKVHFTNLFFPGYATWSASSPGSRIGFGARTGGLNANHWLDDVTIETYTTPQLGFAQNPQNQIVVAGSSATFNIVLNNGDTATVQWLRDGIAIPGATETSYTLAGATAGDTAARFSARVTAGATTQTSTEATLTVVTLDLPTTPVLSFDFNDGAVPPEATILGTAVVGTSGGVGGSGVLQLTDAFNDMRGAFIVADQHANAPVYGVAARFDLRIGGGTEPPADGMSFNFANDLPDSDAGDLEEGVGSGLRVCFDIFDNGGGEAPAVTLKWGASVLAETKLTTSEITTGDDFADVIVRLTPDGLVDVAWNGRVLINRVAVPGFDSVSGGRFGFYARTGGLNANQWLDNIRLYTYLTAPLRISTQPVDQITPVGRPANFSVQVTTPTGATYQWFRDGAPIASGGTASTYTIPATVLADSGAKFKVRVTLGAESVESTEATLTVVDLTAPTNPQLTYDFNNGLPAGTEIEGVSAFVDSTGGVGDSGVLKLTTSQNDQRGGFRSELIQGGAQLLDFTLAADVLAGNGTASPADGFSINLGSDVPVIAPGDAEEGAGTGITVTFDTYDNTDGNPNNEAGEAPSIDIRYKGVVVATKRVPLALVNSGTFDPVLLRVRENGLLDLAVGNTVVYQDLQLPAYVPMSGLKLALYARTGGANASYWFDNVRLGYTIPTAVTISDEPDDVLVLAGGTATFQVQVGNPQGITYQWRRNGENITGATSATYTTPALSAADDGATYSVVVTGAGGSDTSREAIASVMPKFEAGASPAVNLNFDDLTLPTGGAVFGNALIQVAGGVDGTPYLELTIPAEGQSGSFLLDTPAGAAPITDFTATWMMLVGGGTDTPADGFSFILGSDVGDGTFGEDGAGSGLIVSFDTYDNGDTEVAPEITIRYKGTTVMTRPFDISVLRTGDVFEQIGVRVNNNGTLDLYYGDTAVYRALPLPGYTPFAAGRFGWGARTGGLWDNHWVDDIKIALNTQPALGPEIGITFSGGSITLTWPGGGTLQSTTALPGGWTDVPGATSGYTTQTTGTATFYRVEQ